MKLRVLVVTEASYLSTGYAVYTKEVLKRLYQHPQLEIAELACYCSPSDPRRTSIPWKHYPNLPSNGNEEEKQFYESNPINCFGAWKFEQTCLDFKPHVVYDLRDIWMINYQATSPYRKCYNLLWMIAVDGFPQQSGWMSDYAQADAITSYTDWGCQILHNQSGGSLPILGSTPPAADDIFSPVINKTKHKAKFGLDKMTIIGTVMRNQKRKLFPDLFLTFRELLNQTGRNDLFLYCHTPYPDKNPWNIPELINEYGLSNKVLMTYECDTAKDGCGFAFPSFFNDFIKVCPNCHRLNATTADVNNGVDNKFLAELYNLFDIYVQYACLEAFGLPICEAAACGVPVMTVDTAGLSDNGRKLGAMLVPPISYVKEIESGRMMAVPDNQSAIKQLKRFLSLSQQERTELAKQTRENYLQNYSYDTTANKYLQYFLSLNAEELDKRWSLHPDIQQSEEPSNKINELSNLDFTKWLILKVIKDQNWLGSYFHTRILKDINYGCSTSGGGDNYLNDFSAFGNVELRNFTREDAYNMCRRIRENKNFWEEQRARLAK